MKLKTANHSHYPRMGLQDEHHQLRRAYHLFDRKKIDSEALKKIQKETIRGVIREQHDRKLEVVTDGLILWHDPISHFMKRLAGVEINGLLRFFDTNFYFRQPVISGKLARKSSSLAEEIEFLKRESEAEIKAVLTGPYTLALLSKIDTDLYDGTERLAEALAKILSEEVEEVAGMGVAYIQIEEPAYLVKYPDWKWAFRVLEKLLARKGNARVGLVTYFGDAAPVYPELQRMPVDFLGFDVTYSPTLLDRIRKEGSGKDLALGLIDGRNTKLEAPLEVARSLHVLDRALSGRTVYVTTSCGLEYLPRERAFDKLGLLTAVKYEYEKGA